MKEVTTTKYECDDGTRFEDKGKAQAHQLKLWFTDKATTLDEEGNPGRLTSAGMLEFIGTNPSMTIAYLSDLEA